MGRMGSGVDHEAASGEKEWGPDLRGIIFLDIDGVLVNRASMARGYGVMDEGCVRVLDDIVVRHPEARIIISSTWRILSTLREIRATMQRYGFRFGDRIVGKTTTQTTFNGRSYVSRPRSLEILHWLENNQPIHWWVAIDDEKLELPNHLQIDTILGLQPLHLLSFQMMVLHQKNSFNTVFLRGFS